MPRLIFTSRLIGTQHTWNVHRLALTAWPGETLIPTLTPLVLHRLSFLRQCFLTLFFTVFQIHFKSIPNPFQIHFKYTILNLSLWSHPPHSGPIHDPFDAIHDPFDAIRGPFDTIQFFAITMSGGTRLHTKLRGAPRLESDPLYGQVKLYHKGVTTILKNNHFKSPSAVNDSNLPRLGESIKRYLLVRYFKLRILILKVRYLLENEKTLNNEENC